LSMMYRGTLLTYQPDETNTCHQRILTLFFSASSLSATTTSNMSAAQRVQQHPVFLQAQNKATYYVNQLDKEVTIYYLFFPPSVSLLFLYQLTKYPVLNTLEQRTQVPKAYAVIGALIFVVILHTFNSLAAPISNLVGWGLPAYLSFKAIESPSPHDDVQWLTYWVVFGFFNFLESFALRVVLYYVPWYFAFKSLFIIWLQLPAFRVSPLLFSFCFLAPLHYSIAYTIFICITRVPKSPTSMSSSLSLST
jgi:receptor expression-enhancing protein 5/6